MHIDRDFLQQTLTELVQIDSVNPSLTAGAAGEAEIADYTQSVLEQLGLITTSHNPADHQSSAA